MIDWYDLNARHEAVTLWLGAFLIYALATSGGVRGSVLDLLKILKSRTIVMLFMGLLLVVAALAAVAVFVGRIVGLWENPPIVTVSVWTMSSGFGLLMNFDNFLEKDGEFKRASAVLTPAAIITALTNIAILSIWWEVALLPCLAILSVIFTHYDSEDADHQMYRAVKTLLLLYTLVLVAIAIRNIVEDPGTWKSLVQAGLMPIWLTLGILPYIRLLIFVEQWRFSFRCPGRMVASTDYGRDWPLIVDSAKLCNKHGAVWVEVNGRKYGLNGTAATLLPRWGHNCYDLTAIQKDHSDLEDIKVSPHRLLQDGLTLDER